MSEIHPTAVVDSRAQLGRDVTIGAYAIVGRDVELGDGCILHPHASVLGPARYGRGNEFFPYSVVGGPPQDLKYKGGPTRLEVGDQNVFREHVTAHRGTEVDRRSAGVTRIGNRGLFMIGVHIAHDADIGDHIIIANGVQLAGHVRIEDFANLGGMSGMHHFVTVGRYAFVGAMSRITHDVPPYMKVVGHDQQVRGVNGHGMRRWKIGHSSMLAIKRAWRLLYVRRRSRAGLRMLDAMTEIENNGLMHDEHVRYLVEFLRRKHEIGIFGRSREHERFDVPADRAAFYTRGAQEESLA